MSEYIFAAPIWTPIAASPLGNAASGPVQSTDMRRLWWWTSTKIAFFDLMTGQWSPAWAWDGATIYCASQGAGPVIFTMNVYGGSTYPQFRRFNAGQITPVYIAGTTGGANIPKLANTLYFPSGGGIFVGGYQAYDPGWPNDTVLIAQGGSNVAFFGLNIKSMGYERGNFTAIGGPSSAGNVMQCGMSLPSPPGNYYAESPFYFRAQGGTGFPLNTDLRFPYQTLSANYGGVGTNYCQTLNNYPNGLTVNFGVISSWDNFHMASGVANFDAGCNAIVQNNPYGGWLGQAALLLVTSQYVSKNPKTFTYSQFFRSNAGANGQFGIPISVSYNPLGDAPLQYAIFSNYVFAGETGSTNWFTLSLASYSLASHTTVNFMGTML